MEKWRELKDKMVKMVNIIQDGDIIMMECLREGKTDDACQVAYDIKNDRLLSPGKCDTYISQAIFKVKSLIATKGHAPEEASSWWY